MTKQYEPMSSEEFLAALRAVIDPLERGKARGGLSWPDMVAVDDAMTNLVNSWLGHDHGDCRCSRP